MANPRLFTTYEGIAGKYVTYKYDSTIVFNQALAGGAAQVGLAVALKSGGTVGLTVDGELLEGKLDIVENDGFCQVQVGGYCTLPAGNGATVTPGKKVVGALGPAAAKGYIRDAASAGDALVANAEVVDGTDTAATVVDLG